MSYRQDIAIAAARVAMHLDTVARELGSLHGRHPDVIYEAIRVAAKKPEDRSTLIDKRARSYRVRLQIFDGQGNLVADTDPDTVVGEPGSEVLNSLTSVADWASDLVHSFHNGVDIPELEPRLLKAKQANLRPMLSRKGGASFWRLPYAQGEETWRAVVHIQRLDAGSN